MIAKILLLVVLMLYLVQVLICSIINGFNGTRIPESFKDLFKLTYLPYLLRHLNESKHKNNILKGSDTKKDENIFLKYKGTALFPKKDPLKQR